MGNQNNKQMKFAVIGGIGIIGAAFLYHYMSQTSETEEMLDNELAALHPLARDPMGRIEWEHFQKIFEICAKHGK